MNGWISPRLGIRFEMTEESLELYRPNGQRFLTSVELEERAIAAEKQTQQLQEQLQQTQAEKQQLQEQANEAKSRIQALEEILRRQGINLDDL